MDRRQQKAGARAPNWVLAVLALGLVATSIYVVMDYLTNQGINHQAFEAAGSFFSFAYGIPVTLIGALFAFWAGRAATEIQHRQGDLEILKFVEEKSAVVVELQREVTLALGYIAHCGEQGRKPAKQLLAMLETGEVGSDEDFDRFVRILNGLTAQSDESDHEALLDQYAADINRWAERRAGSPAAGGGEARSVADCVRQVRQDLKAVGRACQNIKAAIDDIHERFSAMVSDLHTAMLCRDRFEALGEREPAGWLKATLGDRVPAGALPGMALEELTYALKYLARETVARELVGAIQNLPDDADGLDIAGMTLLRRHFPAGGEGAGADGSGSDGGRQIVVNIGGACLLAAWHYAPDKASILDSFRKVFDEGFQKRRDVALRYVDLLLPDEGKDPAVDRMAATFRLDEARLRRLVVVRSEGGAPQFYDPSRHDPLWADGPARGALQAVRRMFEASPRRLNAGGMAPRRAASLPSKAPGASDLAAPLARRRHDRPA
ncbi:MAG: hypothetical protein KF842_15835 [Caulobacter sp.]|nr:hypothetical protein [Caulobacter sp.]